MTLNPQPPPTDPIASTSQAPWLSDPDVPFWLPNWVDTFKYLRWRWLLFIPAAIFIAAVLAIPFGFPLFGFFFYGGWKLATLAIGLAISTAAYGIRNAIQSRRDPFCIHCGYTLLGLPDHHNCPECGRKFSFTLIDEYRRDPHWFIERCRSRQHQVITHAPFAAGPARSKRKSKDGT